MADDLDTATKQVADAFYGTNQPRAIRDAHGLGDPPRALTFGMKRYLDEAVSSLFGLAVGAAVLFTLSHVVTVLATGNLLFPPVLPAACIAMAVISGKRRASGRRRIQRVLENGVLTGAV